MASILVIGSTGNVGNATVNALSSKGIKTRAGVRDPSTDKALALKALSNVEVVRVIVFILHPEVWAIRVLYFVLFVELDS